MAARLRLDQNQEETSSRREERLKILTRGGGGGSGVLIIGCCALIAAGVGAALAAHRARGRGRGSGDGGEGTRSRGTRDLVPSVDGKEGREDSRGEIIVDCLVGDQLEELSLGGVEDDDDDGMAQFNFEIKQKLEGSETAHAHVEEVPFIGLHEEEETESSSTGGDEGSEGTGDTSVESNEERVWRAELPLGRVEDSAARFVIEQSSEEAEITCVEGPNQEAEAEAESEGLETTHVEKMDREEGAPSIKLREGGAESSSSGECVKGEEGSEGTGNEEEMKQIQVPQAAQLQGDPCDDDNLTESEIVEETKERKSSCRDLEMSMIARQLGQKYASNSEMVVQSLASLATIANSDVVTDTKKNEVEANMDGASTPVEEGTYMEQNLVNLEEEHVRGEGVSESSFTKSTEDTVQPVELTDRMNVSVPVNDIEDMFALTENEERDCQNTEMDSETLGTRSISKNAEVVVELGADIDNGDDFQGQYKRDTEKSEITNIEEDQELLEEFGEEERELVNEVGRSIEGSEAIQDSSVESSVEEEIFPEQGKELSPLRTDDMVGTAQAEELKVEDLGVIEGSSLESSAEEIFPEEEKELPSTDLEKVEQVETPMRNNDMVGIAQAEEEQKVEDLEVIQDSSFESSAEETFPEKEKELPSIDSSKIEQGEIQKTTDDVVGLAQAEEDQNIEDSKRTDDMIGIEKAEEEHHLEGSEVIQDSSLESNAEEKEFPSIDLQKIEQIEPSKMTDGMVGIVKAEEQEGEDPEVTQDTCLKSSREEIFPEEEKELPSIDFKKIEQLETPKTTDNMVGTAQAEEEHEVEEEIFREREKESSTSRTDDMVAIAQAEGQIVADLEVTQDSSSLESSAEKMSPGQEEELPSIDLKKMEQLETPTTTDDMVGMAKAEGQIVEDLEVTEDSSLDSNAEEIFPEEGKELSWIDLEKIEQVETPTMNHGMVGIAQDEEEQKLEDLEVIQDSSFESSAEEIIPEEEKELPSIDLSKIEQAETQKATDDMVGIAQAEEDENIEDSEVIQGPPMESSAEETFPEKEQVLPSIDLEKIEVETQKRTDDMIGIERAEEEHNIEHSEVIQDSSWESNAEEKEFPSIDLEKIEQVETSKMTDDMVGMAQVEEEEKLEDLEVIQDSSFESSVEETFPEKEKESPSIDSEKIEQVETPMRNNDMVGIAQAEELKAEDSEVIQDSSSLQSSAEEMSPGQEEELPMVGLKKIEQLETPTMTDDMVGTTQAEGQVVEDMEVIEDSSLESNAEEIFPEEEKEFLSIDLEKIGQVETPMRNNDMVGIAQAEEEQKLEDLEVIEDSSLESNAEEIIPEEEKEFPSIDLEKIEQVETPMRNNDMVVVAQAEGEQKLEDSEVIQDSSFESSAEETFPEKEKELPSIDLSKIEQVEAPMRNNDRVGTAQAEEEQKLEDLDVIQGSSMESSAEETFPEKEKVLPSIDLEKIEVETPKKTDDMIGIQRAEEEHNLEDSEVIQDSSWESNAEEKELPSIDLKKIEQVETPKMTEDMAGIEQAEEEQEGEGPAEEIFRKKKQELPSSELQKIEQVEAPKRIVDMACIEQAEEEEDIVEDAKVIQGSSLKSSIEEGKELPSIDCKKIEQVEDLEVTAEAEEGQEECEEKVAREAAGTIVAARGRRMDATLPSSLRVLTLLLLAMGLALGLLAFAQPDSLYRSSNHLPEVYHKLSQLLFASYQRAVGDI